MKKQHFKIGILVTIIVLLFNYCEKERFDFRNKYVGTWNFEVETSNFNVPDIGDFSSDDYEYTGEIRYGETDNKINIIYGENYSIELAINKDGELSDFPTHYCSGNFIGNDSIHLYIRTGGLGGGSSHLIEGKKR